MRCWISSSGRSRTQQVVDADRLDAERRRFHLAQELVAVRLVGEHVDAHGGAADELLVVDAEVAPDAVDVGARNVLAELGVLVAQRSAS